MHLISWESICRVKAYGGLGVRKTQANNIALLGKLVWYLMTDDTKLWVQVLWHKYVNRQRAQPRNRTSHTWRSIQEALPMFEKCISWRVGTGENVRFWLDIWCGSSSLLHQSEWMPPEGDLNRTVDSYWDKLL